MYILKFLMLLGKKIKCTQEKYAKTRRIFYFFLRFAWVGWLPRLISVVRGWLGGDHDYGAVQ